MTKFKSNLFMFFFYFYAEKEAFVVIIWKEKWQVFYKRDLPGLKRNHLQSSISYPFAIQINILSLCP